MIFPLLQFDGQEDAFCDLMAGVVMDPVWVEDFVFSDSHCHHTIG